MYIVWLEGQNGNVWKRQKQISKKNLTQNKSSEGKNEKMKMEINF